VAPVVKVLALVLAIFGIVGLVAIAAYSLFDQPSHIDYYRAVDEQTLLMGTISGPGATVRVTNVVETPEQITITVSAFHFQLGPQTASGVLYESEAKLGNPLGNRIVVDGSGGQRVMRVNCPPPFYYATECP
jgi:hypothetical protein